MGSVKKVKIKRKVESESIFEETAKLKKVYGEKYGKLYIEPKKEFDPKIEMFNPFKKPFSEKHDGVVKRSGVWPGGGAFRGSVCTACTACR